MNDPVNDINIDQLLEKVGHFPGYYGRPPFKLMYNRIGDTLQKKLFGLKRLIDLTRFNSLIGIYTYPDYNQNDLLDNIRNSAEYNGLQEPYRSEFLACRSNIATNQALFNQWITQELSLVPGMIAALCNKHNGVFKIIDDRYNPMMGAFVSGPPGTQLFRMIAIIL